MVEQIPLIDMVRHAILATAPDVVVAHIDITNLRVIAAMLQTGIPVIACEHTDTSQVHIGQFQNAREALYRVLRLPWSHSFDDSGMAHAPCRICNSESLVARP
jgi:hypothetical protein